MDEKNIFSLQGHFKGGLIVLCKVAQILIAIETKTYFHW